MKNHGAFRNRQNLVVLTLVAGFVLGCDAYVRIPGRVIDESGDPIEGAKIEIYEGGRKLGEEESNIEGRFDIQENVTPMFTSKIKVVASRQGFVTRELQFSARELPINPNVDPNIPKERVITLSRQ
jgi:hypothetical protein